MEIGEFFSIFDSGSVLMFLAFTEWLALLDRGVTFECILYGMNVM